MSYELASVLFAFINIAVLACLTGGLKSIYVSLWVLIRELREERERQAQEKLDSLIQVEDPKNQTMFRG